MKKGMPYTEELEHRDGESTDMYSKNTHVEGNMGMNHDKGYEPTHVIHKEHGGIAGAGVDGHHKK